MLIIQISGLEQWCTKLMSKHVIRQLLEIIQKNSDYLLHFGGIKPNNYFLTYLVVIVKIELNNKAPELGLYCLINSNA